MRSSSAARWPTPSSPRRARMSASRCASTTCWTTPGPSWRRRRARLRDRAADRRGGRLRVQGRRALQDRAGRQCSGGQDDPRYRTGFRSRTSAGRLSNLKTLMWNGPLGAFEVSPFDQGHQRGGEGSSQAHQGGQADERGRRRRHSSRAGARRGPGRLLLHLTAGGAFLRVARGQEDAPASRCCGSRRGAKYALLFRGGRGSGKLRPAAVPGLA